MTIKKTNESIVCDVYGCPEIADYEVKTVRGARYFVCKKCLQEAYDSLKEFYKKP